jgi:hypothetical protein
LIQQQNPEVVFMAPVCTPWSPLRNIAPLEVREAERKIMLPMVKFCVQVALHQKSKGRFFIIENPENSAMWNQEDMAALAALEGSNWGTTDMCCYGLRDPVSSLLMVGARVMVGVQL